MADMALCPNCDNMIPPGTATCPYCETALNADGSLVRPMVVEEVETLDSSPAVAGPEAAPAPSLQETLRNANLPQTEYAESWSPDQLNRIDDLNQVVTTRPTYQTQVQPYATSSTADSGGFLWGVLGFIMPPAGFILWLLWHRTHPARAKAAVIGAVLGLIFGGGFVRSCGGAYYY